MDSKTAQAVQVIWDFCHLETPLSEADAMIVLGTREISHTFHAVELYKRGLAPLVVISGNTGKGSETAAKAEWERMKEILLEAGVPEQNILIEPQATNTGENIIFSRKLLESRGISVNKIILVSKPYMSKRAWATASKIWPEVEVLVSTHPISALKYFQNIDPIGMATMVGDAERIIYYPRLGFQVAVPYDVEVEKAICFLRSQGYNRYALKDYEPCK